MAALGPDRVAGEREDEFEQEVARRAVRQLERYLHRGGIAGGDGGQLERPGLDRLAVGRQAPLAGEALETGEVEAVRDAELALRRVDGLDEDGLVDLLHLGHGGGGSAVGLDEAVADEVGVVGVVAEVAAVGVVGAAVFGGLRDAVVAPFPDEAAAAAGVAADRLPVLLDAAGTVAHGVDVLAEHERHLAVALRRHLDLFALEVVHRLLLDLRLADLDDFLLSGVHAAVDVDDLAGVVALVVDRAAGVERLRGVAHLDVVDAEAGLVAEGPEDDGGVVAVAQDHAAHAVDELGLPGGVVGGVAGPVGPVADAEAVRLEVALVDQVDAVAVAEVVPARIVRVVAGAHGVEVVALEQEDVLDHALERHGAAELGVRLVAVAALEDDAPAVDLQDAVDDVHLLEADVERRGHRGALPGVRADHQTVEVRILGGPVARLLHVGLERDDRLAAGLDGGFALEDGHRGAFSVEELGADLDALRGRLAGVDELHVDGEDCVLELLVERRRRGDVVDAHGRRGDDGDVAEDAGEPPHVLVLGVGAGGPLPHAHGEDVATAEDGEFRDVELGGEAGAHRHADVLPVEVALVAGVHAVETQADRPAVPGGGQVEVFAVRARGILVGDVRRVDVERVLDVGVPGLAIAEHLPHRGDGDGIPLGVVMVDREVVGRGVLGAFGVAELPFAAQGADEGRIAGLGPFG